MKEETKRFYDFTLEDAKQKLGIKGKIIFVSTKDEKGQDGDKVHIITIETKEE